MANLPVPVLASEVPGRWVTAALWRACVYNTGSFLLNPPLFVGTQSTVQSVASNAWTVATLNTEQIDSYSGHSTTVNSSRYTAQVAGWYTMCGVVAWVNNTTGVRGSRLHINGSALRGASQMTSVTPTSPSTVATPTRAVYLAIGDYVEVAGWQSSGAALSTTVSSESACALWVCWSHA